MTELRLLCIQMIEALEMFYHQGKITKEELENHTRLKRAYIAITSEDAA